MDKAGHYQQTSNLVQTLSKTEVEDVNSELGFKIICLNVKSSNSVLFSFQITKVRSLVLPPKEIFCPLTHNTTYCIPAETPENTLK